MTLDVYWNQIYIEDRVATMPDDITENFINVRVFNEQFQLRMESSDDEWHKINFKISVNKHVTGITTQISVVNFFSQKCNNYFHPFVCKI